jgi:hypothetical protein
MMTTAGMAPPNQMIITGFKIVVLPESNTITVPLPIRSALHDVAGGAEKLRNVLSLPDASTKLLRFVSDDIWGSRGRCRVISRSIAEYLVQAWDVRNSCKHNGAVLPLPSAPEGRGADGVDAMA